MSTKRKIKKILTLIVMVAIVVSSVNVKINWRDTYGTEKIEIENYTIRTTEKAKVVKELKSERTEKFNTYLMSDGRKKLEITNEKIRYKEEGKWKTYNTNLKKMTEDEKRSVVDVTNDNEMYEYANISGDSKQFFSKKINGKDGILMKKGKQSFSFIPITETDLLAQVQENEIIYTNKNSDIEYKYESLKNGIKESIILNRNTAKNKFLFKLNLNKMKAEIDRKNGNVIIKNNGKEVARLEAPNLIDANNNINYKNVRYALKGNILTLEVDKSYLNNPETAYPVIIDPTALWTNNCLTTASVDSMSYIADNNYHMDILRISNKCRTRVPFVGTEERAYVMFDLKNAFVGDASDFSNKYIAKAQFGAYEAECNYNSATIELRSPQRSWNASTITWNNQPKMGQMWGSFKCNGKKGTYHKVDITDWAQALSDGKIENTGFVISAKESGTGANLYGNTFKYGGTDGNGHGYAYNMSIAIEYYDIDPYDASVNLDGTYNKQKQSLILNAENINRSMDNESIKGYKIYTRKNNAENFEPVINGDDFENIKEVNLSDINSRIDVRIAALYSSGKVKLSNIISFEKSSDEKENNFSKTSFDTDGDGLEDGYEIWDLNTLWNKKKDGVNNGKEMYVQDTDGDGLPDGYEVKVLGTSPTIKNKVGQDSDGDGWSDVKEYEEGTNPWLKDTDFDGLEDSKETNTNPLKTDNSNIEGTDKNVAYNSAIHLGLYDKEKSYEKDGIVYKYIENIYSNELKQFHIEYENGLSGKITKYFYNNGGNIIAIVEQNGEEAKRTKCVTYAYDEENNIEFICDDDMKYSMIYKNKQLCNLKIGDTEVENKKNSIIQDNTAQIDKLNVGDMIKSNKSSINYSNNQNMEIVTKIYKVKENDFKSTASIATIYYDNASNQSYEVKYNSEGNMLQLTDYTQDFNNPVKYDYTSENGNTVVKRSDGFIKTFIKKEETNQEKNEHVSTTTIKYNFKDIDGVNRTKENTLISAKTKDDYSTVVNPYGIGKYTRNVNDRVITERYFSNTSDKTAILNMTQIQQSKTNITRTIHSNCTNSDGECYKSNVDYSLDQMGNMLSMKRNNKIVKEMQYDKYGALVEEKYGNKCIKYTYDDYGNLKNKINNIANTNVKIPENFYYENNKKKNQLTSYELAGKKYAITYDSIGNPINYINGKKLEWERGRKLSKVWNDNEIVQYKYNEKGQRSHQIIANTSSGTVNETSFEWDDDKLIKERVKNVKTDMTYDVWYLYNEEGEVIGYDYITIDSTKNISKTRVIFEKDLNGSIIGLWNDTGYEFATYTYDYMGRIVDSSCDAAWKKITDANHLGYKSYYYDEVSGFYYDQNNNYYVPQIGQLLNYSQASQLIEQEEKYISTNQNYKEFIRTKDSDIVLPMEQNGYSVAYGVDDSVDYCDTKSLFFESMNLYNTNCYGFAINCWTYKKSSTILPGIFGQTIDYETYADSVKIAEDVKKDMNYLGKDAIILKGQDNTPYYPTDNEHCLIAVRVMSKKSFETMRERDYCHFMIRKDDGWYFKSGWKVGIFKLKGNKTPDDVIWTQYEFAENGRVKYHFGKDFAVYTENIQYIVIPKMAMYIKE